MKENRGHFVNLGGVIVGDGYLTIFVTVKGVEGSEHTWCTIT